VTHPPSTELLPRVRAIARRLTVMRQGAVKAVIEDIAYFGSHSVYHVRLPSGAKVLANFANSQRWASDGLTWGDEVWVHWRDNDGVVLTS